MVEATEPQPDNHHHGQGKRSGDVEHVDPLGERRERPARAFDDDVIGASAELLVAPPNTMKVDGDAGGARGLKLVGWIANSIDPAMVCQDENVSTLERQLSAPRIASIRWGHADAPEWSSIDAIEARVNFSSRRDPC